MARGSFSSAWPLLQRLEERLPGEREGIPLPGPLRQVEPRHGPVELLPHNLAELGDLLAGRGEDAHHGPPLPGR
jgi:hypothetical protein